MSFKISSVGHFFAICVHDVKVGLTFLVAHQAQAETVVNVATAALDPALLPIETTLERAGEGLLGDALALVDSLDEATAAKGTSLPLDKQTIADLKLLLADIRKVHPAASNVPVGLPTITASA